MTNAHQSRRQVSLALREVYDGLAKAQSALHAVAVERHHATLDEKLKAFAAERRGTTPQWVRHLTPSEIRAAQKEGIYDEPLPDQFTHLQDDDVPLETIERLERANRHANQSAGHQYRSQRRRKKKQAQNHQRKAGGGFSYKPEIPWRRAGVTLPLTGDAYAHWEEIEEELAHPKYARDHNHPEQTLPKLEWHVLRRKGRNKRESRKHTGPSYRLWAVPGRRALSRALAYMRHHEPNGTPKNPNEDEGIGPRRAMDDYLANERELESYIEQTWNDPREEHTVPQEWADAISSYAAMKAVQRKLKKLQKT